MGNSVLKTACSAAVAIGVAMTPAFAGGGDAYGAAKNFKSHWIVGTFVGVTNSAKSTEATYGFEAMYKTSQRFAVGGIAEHLPDAGDGFDAQIYLGTVNYMATSHLRLIGGAGVEKHHGHTYGLYRVGAAYDMHFGPVHISPTVELDFVNGKENTVYGVTFGREF